MSEEKTVQEVYEDRNALALGFAEMVHRYHEQLVNTPRENRRDNPEDFRACWQPDEGDDADADEWAIVYAWIPTGQVSWHVPKEMAQDSTLPEKYAAWDGHLRAEKNQRVLALTIED